MLNHKKGSVEFFSELNKELDFLGIGVDVRHATEFFSISRKLKNGIIVEIGSGAGSSAIAFALGAGNWTRVFSVDHFAFFPEAENIFFENIKKAGVQEKVVQLKSSSFFASLSWNKQIDALFIDASHSYAGVKEDFLLWEKFLKVGGYICFHDYNFSGVKAFLDREIMSSKRFAEWMFFPAGLVVMRKTSAEKNLFSGKYFFVFCCEIYSLGKLFVKRTRNVFGLFHNLFLRISK